jgi:hypothetical protein
LNRYLLVEVRDDMTSPGINFPKNSPPARLIFLSYRSIDDEPPPEDPNGGYVRHLRQQLRWELSQLGVPDAILWMDRYKIQPGDIWSEVLRDELNKADLFIAVLSRNYINSDWCETELMTMAARVATFEKEARHRRIFRVDKHLVPDESIHEVLRGAQAVRFFEHDKEDDREEEYFHRGQVRSGNKYYEAVRQLAEAIHLRLEELGVEMGPQSKPLTYAAPMSKGRVIFVAKPARDMILEYRTLTAELVRSGYHILPDPTADLPETAEEVQAAIVKGLAEAELSVHLLGERAGLRPDGLTADIVPFQLSCAAAEAEKRPSFYRMIWAPKVMPTLPNGPRDFSPRDPFQVVGRFGAKLPSDQVDSDTATRFNEFVFQRLGTKTAKSAKTIYVHCAHSDRPLAVDISKALKRAGYSPVVRPDVTDGTREECEAAEVALIGKAQRTILCWGKASKAALLNELNGSTLVQWRMEEPSRRSTVLFIGPPTSSAKTEVIELGLGEEIDKIVDISAQAIPGAPESNFVAMLE